jgi:hypothetical protein
MVKIIDNIVDAKPVLDYTDYFKELFQSVLKDHSEDPLIHTYLLTQILWKGSTECLKGFLNSGNRKIFGGLCKPMILERLIDLTLDSIRPLQIVEVLIEDGWNKLMRPVHARYQLQRAIRRRRRLEHYIEIIRLLCQGIDADDWADLKPLKISKNEDIDSEILDCLSRYNAPVRLI